MQPKKPRFNPLVIAIVLAAVLMVWSVLGGTGGNANGSSMAYSTVVHYFESNQVTKFSLDLNTGVITMTLKEGAQELPNAAEQTTTQSTGGLLSGLLSSSSSAPTGVKKNDDGTETVSYKLPYARMFVDHVSEPSMMQPTPMRPWCTIMCPPRRPSPGWRSCSIWLCWAAPAFCCSP